MKTILLAELREVNCAGRRLLWIGYDNHTVIAAGALLPQIARAPGIPFLPLRDAAPIPSHIDSLRTHEPADRPSPLEFLARKHAEADRASALASEAAARATRNREEAERVASDARAVSLVARFYRDKAAAAVAHALFETGPDRRADAEKSLRFLEASLGTFRELTELTRTIYESISDVPASHPERLSKVPYHWTDLLPIYEREARLIEREIRSELSFGGRSDTRPSLPGLAGVFYGDPNWLSAERAEPAESLDLSATLGKPGRGMSWSMEWFGSIIGPVSGTVRFEIDSDRRTDMMVGTNSLRWERGEKAAGGVRFEIPMQKGRAYPFRLAYNHDGGKEARLRVRWSWKGRQPEDMQTQYLRHSPADKRRMERIAPKR